MREAKKKLFIAFREDHALLGRAFHEISTALRGGNTGRARTVAMRASGDAGAHIAFEEEHFYPILEPLLGKEEVAHLYAAHKDGLSVLRGLSTATEVELPERERHSLLAASEAMERHIAECGELFEAIGRISEREQEALLDELMRLRREKPDWIASAVEKCSPEQA